MASEPVVYVVDAGSVSKGNFHWVSSGSADNSSDDPSRLAESIVSDLQANRRVALGYESPLFVPCDVAAEKLGKARIGECEKATGSRPFNAGAGASILATGIQSLAWVLRRVKALNNDVAATTVWREFEQGDALIFVWEAFVSGSEKAYPPSHAGDARLAIKAFRSGRSGVCPDTRISCVDALSLAGAAIIYAGLSTNFSLLSEPCVVVRPIFLPEEAASRLIEHKKRLAQNRAAKKRERSKRKRAER